MTRRVKLAATVAVALAAIPAQAHAILFTCTASSAGVAFGTVAGAAVQATGAVRVTCTGFGRPNPVTVALSTGSSGVYNPRRMRSGSQTLAYNLYTSALRTSIFGNGTGGSSTVTVDVDVGLIGSGSVDVFVHGLVPAQSLLAPGSYSDTIMVTVTY